MSRLKEWYNRWSSFRLGRGSLETILFNAPAVDASHRVKRLWVIDLIDWVHSRGWIDTTWKFTEDEVILDRITYLLWNLERSENFRRDFIHTVQSVLLHSEAIELLVTTGVPNRTGLIAELIDRLHIKIFPQPPRDHDLAALATEAFSGQSNVTWLRRLSPKAFQTFFDLLQSQELKEYFGDQIADALLLLSMQIRAAGFSPEVRERLSQKRLRDISFFQLVDDTRRLVETRDNAGRRAAATTLLAGIDRCFASVADVYSHLNEYGVSVAIVYQLDRLQLQLSRMRTLINLTVFDERRVYHLQELLANLIEDLAKSRSIRALLSENLELILKKISDRSAQTGEHYITRDRNQLHAFFQSAVGGGVLMGFTTWAKYLILALPLAPFLMGTAAALNYATSFVLLQLLGFTLATKQPAMTATTLAARMQHLSERHQLEKLVDEILHLFRSQFTAVIGNLVAVPPTVLLIDSLVKLTLGHHLIDAAHAEDSIQSVTIAGPAFAFACFTGLLLFASSQAAGWIDNWFVFRKMGPALRYNRKLQFVFSERGAARIALFFSRNIGGLAGNISLGMMLGILPVLFKFVGLPLDIRHVTLSTGMLTSAVAGLDYKNLLTSQFGLAVVGILVIGLCNIISAFWCSMFVALRAREVKGAQRSQIYRAFWARVWEKPSQLFWV